MNAIHTLTINSLRYKDCFFSIVPRDPLVVEREPSVQLLFEVCHVLLSSCGVGMVWCTSTVAGPIMGRPYYGSLGIFQPTSKLFRLCSVLLSHLCKLKSSCAVCDALRGIACSGQIMDGQQFLSKPGAYLQLM